MCSPKGLHLPDLFVGGFRGIEQLHVLRLGRVTLLAGKNSIGKTSVLEAVRVFAARGRGSTLRQILNARGEAAVASDFEEDRLIDVDWAALFFGRQELPRSEITVGPSAPDKRLAPEG